MTLEAGPARQLFDNYRTGLYEWDVTYSVNAAISIPETNPRNEQTNGTHTLISISFYFLFGSFIEKFGGYEI